ncbi:MAG: helix-turn-helix domain-containing protein [Treponema sp.]
MMNAYDKSYLLDFRNNLGFAFDCIANHCNKNLSDFYDIFIASNIASYIESGNAKYLSGMSGTELILTVYDKVGLSIEIPQYFEFDRSPEYWAGWILAYYQWKTSMSFKMIRNFVPIQNIVKMYNPLHEAPEEKFEEIMNGIIRQKKQSTNLQFLRKQQQLTQNELSTLANVNLRTLQQYETGAKDINKAAGDVINRLAAVLKCNFYDLMELEPLKICKK